MANTIRQLIDDLPKGRFGTLCKVTPVGSLQARKSATGATSFYWRYSMGLSSERVPVGLYDSSAPPKSLSPTKIGYSIAAAIRAAEGLAIQHHQHRETGGRPALLAAQHEAERALADAQQRAATASLKNLLLDYADHLKALGRTSHRDARGIFNLHVIDTWPEIASMPAKDVPSERFADMMRKVIDSGKGRTANKLRSYCRAAYQTAKAARSKPSIPALFKRFDITTNPVASTEPDESQNRADKRPLTANELRAYWSCIKHVQGFKGALLRLHLLTGAQRIAQLVRVPTYSLGNGVLPLLDGKGRPGKPPRLHVIPLIGAAEKALNMCRPSGTYALSTDGGQTHVAATTLSKWAAEAVACKISNFSAKRIRSGVETLLASARTSQEIRGRLQSHGISGVQSRHYDGYDYLAEKRAALALLYRLLNQKDSPNPKTRNKTGARATS